MARSIIKDNLRHRQHEGRAIHRWGTVTQCCKKNVPSYFEVPLSFSSLVDRHKGNANRYTYLHARCAPATDCPSVNSPGKIVRFRSPSLNALLSHKVRFERAMAMITSRMYFSFTNSWCRMFSSLLLESYIAFTFTDMIAVFSRMFFLLEWYMQSWKYQLITSARVC